MMFSYCAPSALVSPCLGYLLLTPVFLSLLLILFVRAGGKRGQLSKKYCVLSPRQKLSRQKRSREAHAAKAAREGRQILSDKDEIQGKLTRPELRTFRAAKAVRYLMTIVLLGHVFSVMQASRKGAAAMGDSAPTYVLVEEGILLFVWIVSLAISAGMGRDRPVVERRLLHFLPLLVYGLEIAESAPHWGMGVLKVQWFICGLIKISAAGLVVVVSEIFLVRRKRKRRRPLGSSRVPTNSETLAPLLGRDVENGEHQELSDDDDEDEEEDDAGESPHEWWMLVAKAWTYVWPETFALRMRVFACVFLVLCARVTNVIVPLFYKRLVDTLYKAAGDAPVSFRSVFIPNVLGYILLFLVQGGGLGSMGVLSNTRSYIWIPVQQDTYKRVSLGAFEHLLKLPLGWHLGRRTGEVLKILDRGTSSLTTILQIIFFSVGPTMLDIVIAAGFFWINFDISLASIILVTLGLYIPMTVFVTEWRAKYRREMNLADNKKTQRVADAVINYETVKYYCGENHESEKYSSAIDDYQSKEWMNLATLNMLNVIQAAVVFSGMIAGLTIITSRVAHANTTGWKASDAVLFLSYLQQLYAPLNYLGSYYRAIQQAFIDVENLFELLATKSDVNDAPNAIDYKPTSGALEIRDVSFAYPGRAPVLNNIAFNVGGGQTVALVGATGCGKSTLLRLLFRFYDPLSGSINLDGHDIKYMTQDSLHAAIGVVPQDTVLFNDTIRYNIGYGRQGASQEEIEEAAEASQIHEIISTKFPDGYGTVVGERGLRLSGGEKQRVAFARAYLKQPSLLLLDEATSSLDSLTEQKITQALSTLRKTCTTVIVAHRLSTIADADMIIVLSDGRIIESGTHSQLLDNESSHYAAMWARQANTSSQDITAIFDGMKSEQQGSSS